MKPLTSLLCSLLILAFVIRFFSFFRSQPVYYEGQQIRFETRLEQEPKQQGRFQKFTTSFPGGKRVFITTPAYPQYRYGDYVSVSGTLHLSSSDGKTPLLSMFFPSIKTVEGKQSMLESITSTIRERVSTTYARSLPPESASLLVGIVFGIKQDMPKEFLDSLRSAGLLHVIAASGMNVTMVAGALFFIFSSFLRRQWAIVISITGIGFYAFLAGLEPSIMRASLMAGIAFTAALLGRQAFAFLALAVTGYAMLFWDPSMLSDVGFQLSFLATAGILFIKPVLAIGTASKGVSGMVASYILSDDMGTTVAAQLATIPVLLGNFGQLGLLSILANVLVLWTVPPLMVLGSVAALLSFVFPPLAGVVLYAGLPFLLFFERVSSFIGSIGWSLRLEDFPFSLSIGYYLLLGALVMLLRGRQQKKGRSMKQESRGKN